MEIPGRRGAILDRQGRVLAGSFELPTVFADPRLIEDHGAAATELADRLAMPVELVRRLLDKPTSPGFVILKRGASIEEASAVEELNIRGVGTRQEPVRSYPMGSLAAQVLGFIGSDGQGLEGVERQYDDWLKPTPGKRVIYRDVRGRAAFQEEGSYIPPKNGGNITLTIDAAIQEVVEREVSRSVEKYKAESGIGIVMDTKTGEVLAMASIPTFDPGDRGRSPRWTRRNRCLTDPVEPGSIFKPFIMAAALSEKLTEPLETIFCHNGLYVTGKRLLHDHHPYGGLTTAEIMIKSSNIGMAILGQRLGNQRMYEALRAFGFGGKTGIDLPGESEGLLMPLKRWTSFSTTSVPMGQELAVTPIQMATAFCSLGNGGLLLTPRVVATLQDEQGRIKEDRRDIDVQGQAMDPNTVAMMNEILTSVVSEGTGRNSRLDDYQVMGKTGTAQVPYTNRRGYEPDAYLGSFIAAAPSRDPAIVALVMIRKPSRKLGYYGGTVAAPAVKTILETTLPYLNIPADPPKLEENTTIVQASPSDHD